MSVECSLDRKKYHPTTIGVFQLIAAHMTDIFYNYLYIEGKKLKEQGRSESITRGFQLRMYAFVKSLDAKAKNYKPERFIDFLEGINRYFQVYTVYETLSISDCINKIVHELVPQDFYDQLGKDQKRDILYSAMFSCINKFATTIAQEYCGLVVDEHDNVENIEILKELAVDLLIKERHEMYKKFITTATSNTQNKKSVDAVDQQIVRQMRHDLHALYKKRDEWEKERAAYVQQIKQLKESVEEKQHIAMDLLEKYRAAREHIQQLKAVLQNKSATATQIKPTTDVAQVSSTKDVTRVPPRSDTFESFNIQHRPLSEVLKQEVQPAVRNNADKSLSKRVINKNKNNVTVDEIAAEIEKLKDDTTPVTDDTTPVTAANGQNSNDLRDSDDDDEQGSDDPNIDVQPDALPGAEDLLADYF
jgi:hypothetical protein